MIYEIRNYHFNPALIEQYKKWAKSEALPYLTSKMDIIGFWVNTSDEPEIKGQPQDDLGPANITWVIQWKDMEHRNKVFPGVPTTPDWQSISSRVPGGKESYLRLESKFAESLL